MTDPVNLMLLITRLTGWALLHFLWQATLLGAAYWLTRMALPRGRARYRCGMTALLAMALCPVLTIWRLLEITPGVPEETTRTGAGMTFFTNAFSTLQPYRPGDDLLDAVLPWAVLVWACGVLLISLRTWRQWRKLKMLVRLAESIPLWQERANQMAARYGIRRPVTILVSELTATPGLVGWIKPVIVLPFAVACSFPAAQVELILAHELAHLQRWDPFANLFQVVLETLYFFHPVVGWASREVRNEREICCDAMALSTTNGSRREFGSTLVALGELRQKQGTLLLAANGGVLMDRVQFMLRSQDNFSGRRAPARLPAMLLGALVMALAMKLEWSQRQLQQELTESIAQWQVKLAAGTLSNGFSTALHVGDLATGPARAMRPAPLPLPGISPSERNHGALPGNVGGLSGAVFAAPLDVRDELPHAVVQRAVTVPQQALTLEPRPMVMRSPVYPRDAMARGIEGQVTIEFSLTARGRVVNPRIIDAKPQKIFNQSALDAVIGWKYEVPPGTPVQRKFRQTMAFTLDPVSSAGESVSRAEEVNESMHGDDCRAVTGTHICRRSRAVDTQLQVTGSGIKQASTIPPAE